MKLQYFTTINNGTPSGTVQEAFNSFEGQRVEITIQKARFKRSNPQNAYFHGVVIPIVTNGLKELGHVTSNTEVKEMLKAKFLSEPLHLKEGVFMDRIKATSQLTKTQFADFIQEIQAFAAEFIGVQIPDPNEQLKTF